jgi:hypothetical protein
MPEFMDSKKAKQQCGKKNTSPNVTGLGHKERK